MHAAAAAAAHFYHQQQQAAAAAAAAFEPSVAAAAVAAAAAASAAASADATPRYPWMSITGKPLPTPPPRLQPALGFLLPLRSLASLPFHANLPWDFLKDPLRR
jgi:hypothetical protein